MGIGEKLKGAFKEKAGDAMDDDQLQAEGNAQQTKGDEQTRESSDRAKAKAHEEKAESLDKEQNALED